MSIPEIPSYSLSSLSGWADNRASWLPERSRVVLLIHDMQQYFVRAYKAGEPPVTELLDNISRLRAYCLKHGIPVLYSAQPGDQPADRRALLKDFWGPGMGAGREHTDIIPPLAPVSEDDIVVKWRYSAFQMTDLQERMRRLERDQLMICGIYAHIGCLMTACEGFMRDIQCFMASDGVADFSPEQHLMALGYAAQRCAVVDSVDGLIAKLENAVPEAAALETAAGTAGQEAPDASEESLGAGGEQAAGFLAEGAFTREKLRSQIAELLERQPSDIGEEDDLVEAWGLDSIRMMSLAERWARQGVEVGFMELAEAPTLASWWSLLSSRSGAGRPNQDYFALPDAAVHR
jgi:bifunctional isochorismate lyase/aryl carrier protein